MKEMRAEIGSELALLSRQLWITFGGLITTIVSVFLINYYFHMPQCSDPDIGI